MKVLKDFVRNPARPEGCIAESYLAEECMNFFQWISQEVNKCTRQSREKHGLWEQLYYRGSSNITWHISYTHWNGEENSTSCYHPKFCSRRTFCRVRILFFIFIFSVLLLIFISNMYILCPVSISSIYKTQMTDVGEMHQSYGVCILRILLHG